MKKYLFIALAALGFAACTESGDEKTPVQNAEMEESYIAINLMAADNDTRAVTNDEYGNADQYGYEDGTALERKITSAYFFFFDANGNPFNVTAPANSGATAPAGGKNHLSLTLSTSEETTTENISDISEAVLVLNTYKGVYPSQIVAVINWIPTANTYTLAALHGELATLGNDTNGYVMSNSVYMNGDKMVDAVPLTAANIKPTADAAKAAPVEIYVERIAAKVVLTASGKVAGTDNIFDLGNGVQNTVFKPIGGSDIEVYMQLHGWELYNDYATSNLLKNISNWDIATLGLTWNDIPYFRCYWAQSQETALNDRFEWSYGEGVNLNYGLAVGAHTYCGENTWPVMIDGEGKVTPNANNTKVILKGQLMQKNGDKYEPLELAKWYGNEYAGEAALKTAVANSLKYTLYYPDPEDNSKYISIAPEDIICVEGATDTTDNVEAYEVYFKLSSVGEGKIWYQYSSAGGYQVLGSLDSAANKTATNAYLKGVEPALLYAKGQTYYSVDIEHLGTAGAKYGVVRNHVYQIDIESITGYGSPVYSGDIGFLKPEYPTVEEDTYVAARINVLSWKVVQQGVDIVQ